MAISIHAPAWGATTDFPVCVYATREQAAKAMGISYKSFSTILYKTKRGITNR